MSNLYVPPSQKPSTEYLVGVHYFPGWKEGCHWGWDKVVPYPDRTPLLGYYDENNPEVTDWEIKWALEHGISYFLYCWYRRGTGCPLDEKTLYLHHAIHEGLLHARYGRQMQFAIMWENQGATAGIADMNDLRDNLLPFWIRNYFTQPNYLRVDGKPLLAVYRFERLVEDLGGREQAADALTVMRELCCAEGLGGLTILAEFRGRKTETLETIRDLGFDGAFPYCWHPTPQRATAQEAVADQLDKITAWRQADVLPFVPLAGVSWDPMPWASDDPKSPWLHPDKMKRWRLAPEEFEYLLQQVKAVMDDLPADHLGHRMLLLDNWNEWGEGHYISPHAGAGFGYLNAVREVFTARDNGPDHRSPWQLGLGPYDSNYRAMKGTAKAP